MDEFWSLTNTHDFILFIQKNKSFNFTQELSIWNSTAVTQKMGYTKQLFSFICMNPDH